MPAMMAAGNTLPERSTAVAAVVATGARKRFQVEEQRVRCRQRALSALAAIAEWGHRAGGWGAGEFCGEKWEVGLENAGASADIYLQFPIVSEIKSKRGRTMRIDSISSVPAFDATVPLTPAAQASGSGSAKVSATDSGSTEPAGVSVAAAHTAHAPAPVQAVVNGGEEALAAVYTTSVAGHNYLGTVEQAAGEYVASVSDPPQAPITGIGSSIQTAEQNLTIVIDERV